jgi:hypothetical protein
MLELIREVEVRALGAKEGFLDEARLLGVITTEDTRRLACDAHLTPVVIGGKSQPLDIARASYTVPRWLRRALAQRDGGCRPGCGVSPLSLPGLCGAGAVDRPPPQHPLDPKAARPPYTTSYTCAPATTP